MAYQVRLACVTTFEAGKIGEVQQSRVDKRSASTFRLVDALRLSTLQNSMHAGSIEVPFIGTRCHYPGTSL